MCAPSVFGADGLEKKFVRGANGSTTRLLLVFSFWGGYGLFFLLCFGLLPALALTLFRLGVRALPKGAGASAWLEEIWEGDVKLEASGHGCCHDGCSCRAFQLGRLIQPGGEKASGVVVYVGFILANMILVTPLTSDVMAARCFGEFAIPPFGPLAR